MVEKLVNIIINELYKHNIDRSACLLSSYILNQCLPNSEIVKGFLILGEFYVLHVWIKYNNKIYDIGFMQFLRNNGIKQIPYQISIEEPINLENMDDNYEEFYTTIQIFNKEAYYDEFPHKIKKCIKAVKRKYSKIRL